MSHFKSSISKLSLVVLTSLAVTACGSSGNGGNSSPVQQLNNSVQPKGTQTNNPVQSKGTQPNNSAQPEQQPNNLVQSEQQPNNPAQAQQSQPNNPAQPQPNATGGAVSINDEKQEITYVKITDQNISELNVDGQKINLNVGLASEDIVCCSSFSDSKFGFVKADNRVNYLFYNGNPTQGMPNGGTAEYLGKSVLLTTDETEDIGESTFTVNFGDKTLTGTLNFQTVSLIMDVDGRITDNSFTGTVMPQQSSSSVSGTANVEGKFYGDQAKEISGVFANESNDWIGAFGAQKQN